MPHACATAGIELETSDLGPTEFLKLRDLVHQVEVHAIDFAGFARRAGEILGATPDQIAVASAAFVVGLLRRVSWSYSKKSSRRRGVKTACLSNTNEHHWGLFVGYRKHPMLLPPLAELESPAAEG